jgi:hypothetical protein
LAAFKFLGCSQDKASGGLISPQGKALTPEETASWLKPHDCLKEPLHSATQMTLLANGYRFDDGSGRILTPVSKAPVTRIEVAALAYQIGLNRRHSTLLAMQTVLKDQDPGKPLSAESETRLKAIAESNHDILPAEITDILASAGTARALALKQTVEDSFVDSTRFFDGQKTVLDRAYAAVPGLRIPALQAKTPYFDDPEKRLGAALAEDAAELLKANPVGREILDRLRDGSGKPRLPAMLVLRLGSGDGKEYDRAGAVCIPGDPGSVIISYGTAVAATRQALKEALAASGNKVSDQDRKTFDAGLDQPSRLAGLLLDMPELRRFVLSKLEGTLAHELTHAWQFRRDRSSVETSLGNLPGVILIENEHEAARVQLRYLHEELKTGRSKDLRTFDLDSYQLLLTDYDRWRDDISRNYLSMFPASAASYKTVAGLQAERSGALKRLLASRLMQEGVLGVLDRSLSLLGLDRGSEALGSDETEHAKRTRAFLSETYPSIRTEGGHLLAQRHRSAGRPDLAFRVLSQLEAASKEAFPELPALADEAWRVAETPSRTIPLPERINVLQELRAYHSRHGRPVSPEFEGTLRADYTLWAVEQFAAAKKAATPSERERLLDYAKSFADAAKSEVVAEAIETFRKTKGAAR